MNNANEHQTVIVDRFKDAITDIFLNDVLGAKNLKSGLDGKNNVLLNFEVTKFKKFNRIRVYILFRTDTYEVHLEKLQNAVLSPFKSFIVQREEFLSVLKKHLENVK